MTSRLRYLKVTHLQDRNRDVQVENGLWKQKRKERVGQIERATLTYVRCHM